MVVAARAAGNVVVDALAAATGAGAPAAVRRTTAEMLTESSMEASEARALSHRLPNRVRCIGQRRCAARAGDKRRDLLGDHLGREGAQARAVLQHDLAPPVVADQADRVYPHSRARSYRRRSRTVRAEYPAQLRWLVVSTHGRPPPSRRQPSTIGRATAARPRLAGTRWKSAYSRAVTRMPMPSRMRSRPNVNSSVKSPGSSKMPDATAARTAGNVAGSVTRVKISP